MIFLLCIVAFGASLLTFYSGFGLGTILSAVLFIFFDVPVAIAITAIVHLLNNLFKLALNYKNIDPKIIVQFGIPSLIASFFGAWILSLVDHNDVQNYPSPLLVYHLGSMKCTITLLKLIMASLLLFFVALEEIPFLKNLKWESIGLKNGGLLSGFFGGLSGHQGALRSIFLLKYNLTSSSYIATGTAIACLVDLARLPLYVYKNYHASIVSNLYLIFCTTLAAFAGAYLGTKFIKKVTLSSINRISIGMIIIIALSLAFGLI